MRFSRLILALVMILTACSGSSAPEAMTSLPAGSTIAQTTPVDTGSLPTQPPTTNVPPSTTTTTIPVSPPAIGELPPLPLPALRFDWEIVHLDADAPNDFFELAGQYTALGYRSENGHPSPSAIVAFDSADGSIWDEGHPFADPQRASGIAQVAQGVAVSACDRDGWDRANPAEIRCELHWSENGHDWTIAELPPGRYFNLADIAAWGDRLVVVGSWWDWDVPAVLDKGDLRLTIDLRAETYTITSLTSGEAVLAGAIGEVDFGEDSHTYAVYEPSNGALITPIPAETVADAYSARFETWEPGDSALVEVELGDYRLTIDEYSRTYTLFDKDGHRVVDGSQIDLWEPPAAFLDQVTGAQVLSLTRSEWSGVRWGRHYMDNLDPVWTPALLVSDDAGASWHGVNPEEAGLSESFGHVAAGPAGVLLIGSAQDTEGQRVPKAWISGDGLTWTATAPPPVPAEGWTVLLEGTDNGYRLVTEKQRGSSPEGVWRSADGSHWDLVVNAETLGIGDQEMHFVSIGSGTIGDVVLGGRDYYHDPNPIIVERAGRILERQSMGDSSRVRVIEASSGEILYDEFSFHLEDPIPGLRQTEAGIAVFDATGTPLFLTRTPDSWHQQGQGWHAHAQFLLYRPPGQDWVQVELPANDGYWEDVLVGDDELLVLGYLGGMALLRGVPAG